MSFEIRWSPRAVSDVENHLQYLEKEWDQEIQSNVLDRIVEVLNTISDNPDLYPLLSNEERIHRCVVTPQIVLYYRRQEQRVELITFWDSRQGPNKLNVK